MEGVEALMDEEERADGATGEIGNSEVACSAASADLRERINGLLAKAGTTDRSKIVTGDERDGGFVVTTSTGRSINRREAGSVGGVLPSAFELIVVKGANNDRVYVVKSRDVAPGEGGVNGGRTRRRAGRREERGRRQAELRASNPHLNPVE